MYVSREIIVIQHYVNGHPLTGPSRDRSSLPLTVAIEISQLPLPMPQLGGKIRTMRDTEH